LTKDDAEPDESLELRPRLRDDRFLERDDVARAAKRDQRVRSNRLDPAVDDQHRDRRAAEAPHRNDDPMHLDPSAQQRDITKLDRACLPGERTNRNDRSIRRVGQRVGCDRGEQATVSGSHLDDTAPSQRADREQPAGNDTDGDRARNGGEPSSHLVHEAVTG